MRRRQSTGDRDRGLRQRRRHGDGRRRDYVSTSGTLTFVPGQTSRHITATVSGDMGVEPVGTSFVRLSSSTNATIAVAQGTGTITNDGGAPIFVPTQSERGMTLFGLSLLALGTWRLGSHG